jgi:transposase
MHGIVGLDVGSDTVSVCVLDETGQELGRRHEIANSEVGAQALVTELIALATQHEFTGYRIGLEASGMYWWPLAVHLSTASALATSQVYALNPKLVKDFRSSVNSGIKTDRHDAHLIAEWVRFGRWLPAPFAVDWHYEPLRRMTRLRVHLAESLAREKNYFLTMLFLPFSGFGLSHAFGDPFSPTSWALLEDFTTEELAQTPIDTLVTYLQQHGRKQFADPEATATKLQQAATASYRLHRALHDPMRLVLGTTRATITTLQHQLKLVDQTIARELAGIEQTVGSIPGLGPVWTAALVAEIGMITRFADEAALAQYAGLTWTVHESGHFQAEDTRLTKQGNRYLRYALIEAANSVREHCPEYRTYYETKRAQSPKHAHKRALVLTARKLVRLVDALLRTGTSYQPPEHRMTRKEQTQPSVQRPARHHRTHSASATP